MSRVRTGTRENPAYCRDCGERVWWGRSQRGNMVLLDIQPSFAGVYAPEPHTENDVFRVPPKHTGEKFTCHWETCATPSRKDSDQPREARPR